MRNSCLHSKEGQRAAVVVVAQWLRQRVPRGPEEQRLRPPLHLEQLLKQQAQRRDGDRPGELLHLHG